jgi:hypothetical protein
MGQHESTHYWLSTMLNQYLLLRVVEQQDLGPRVRPQDSREGLVHHRVQLVHALRAHVRACAGGKAEHLSHSSLAGLGRRRQGRWIVEATEAWKLHLRACGYCDIGRMKIVWALSGSDDAADATKRLWAAPGGSLLACTVLDLLFTSCSE